MFKKYCAVCVAAVSILVYSPLAQAQSFFDRMVSQGLADPTSLITLQEYGSYLQSVSGPFALPGVSSVGFTAERGDLLGDGDYSRIAVPLAFEIDALTFGRVTPYVELTLSKTDQTQSEFWMEGTPMQMKVTHDISTLSIVGGAGLGIEVSDGLQIRPLFLVGYSRVEDRSVPATARGQRFRAAAGDSLFNWEVDQVQYGPALEVIYSNDLTADIEATVDMRISRMFMDTVKTSTPGLEAKSSYTTITGGATLDGATGLTLFGRDLRWLAFGGAAAFDEQTTGWLAFSWLGEAGLGLKIVDGGELVPFIDGASIRASLVFGDDVFGWTVGGALNF